VTGDHFQVLHVRITSPPDVTGRLLETLTADSGVLNLVVLKGAWSPWASTSAGAARSGAGWPRCSVGS
jgi:hypothetical protein